MRTKRRTNGGRTKASQTQTNETRALERRVKRLERELAAAQAAHERKLELVRRAANRRLASMMKEIASLRHHEARAEALERLLSARPAPASVEGTLDGEDPRLPG